MARRLLARRAVARRVERCGTTGNVTRVESGDRGVGAPSMVRCVSIAEDLLTLWRCRATGAELERRPRGILRRGTSDPARLAFERERLKAAEHQIVETAERERELAGSLSAHGTPELEHEAPRKRAAAIETELAILRQRGRHGALESSIEPYLTVALGPLPEQPRARRTWEQAAQRIEAYRFEHGITDPHSALGPAPTGTFVRAHWQRAQRDVKRAQRALGHAVARGLDHQL
jgi:hypothetical protein